MTGGSVLRLLVLLAPFTLSIFVFVLADSIYPQSPMGDQSVVLSSVVAFIIGVGLSFKIWPRNSG